MHASGKGDAEANGRRFGQDPDTCHVAIGEAGADLPQTTWLNAGVHHGPYQAKLRTGSWHRSYEKYGTEFGRFIKRCSNRKFLIALREELQDG